MKWDEKSRRADPVFWEELGLNPNAALVAAQCFPEHWLGPIVNRDPQWLQDRFDSSLWKSKRTAELALDAYRTDARHPVFWYVLGHDVDEMATRAVTANAMVNLQREANPPPPPQPDRFPEIAQALLMQGSMQRRLEGPGNQNGNQPSQELSRLEHHTLLDLLQALVEEVRQEPEGFEPDDYPRFRSKGG